MQFLGFSISVQNGVALVEIPEDYNVEDQIPIGVALYLYPLPRSFLELLPKVSQTLKLCKLALTPHPPSPFSLSPHYLFVYHPLFS